MYTMFLKYMNYNILKKNAKLDTGYHVLGISHYYSHAGVEHIWNCQKQSSLKWEYV